MCRRRRKEGKRLRAQDKASEWLGSIRVEQAHAATCRHARLVSKNAKSGSGSVFVAPRVFIHTTYDVASVYGTAKEERERAGLPV